ncbi:MAG: LytR/AlgR family response regulator transcription factor, partial [Vicingaceae bacterium]
GKKTSVNIKDILYLKADGIYTELHTTNKKMLLRTSIKSFEQEYPLIKLVRIHRSFAVNIKAIVSISTSEIQLPNTSLPISRSYKEEVHTVYNELPYL